MIDSIEFGEDQVSELPNPRTAQNVIYNPSSEELRSLSSELERTTEFGSPSYTSNHRSRKSDATKNAIDDDFEAENLELIEDVVSHTYETEMVCIDRKVGRHPNHTHICRFYISKRYARIALSLKKLLEPAPDHREPDFFTVQIPEWNRTAIRILPDVGLTVVAGSDYTGEAKKSFLRLFMYHAKQQGGLGLHAGSKRVRLESNDETKTIGQLFLGLSGTGKSTLTAHGLWLDDPEEARMRQDDVCALLSDGSVAGSEGRGLFVKTYGLNPETEPGIYQAVTAETAVLENVDVASDGSVDFDSDRFTKNGRAIIQRDQLPSADAEIDLDSVDQIFFITRNPLMPPVSKLSPAEAAAAFMLGESVQTSATGPSADGQSVRVVGTNPFIIGIEGEEGNRFRDLISTLDVECYILNTGRVGSEDISVEDTIALLRAITRGTIGWREDETSGLTVPAQVPGMDIDKYDISTNVQAHKSRLATLREEREQYLERFSELDQSIVDARY